MLSSGQRGAEPSAARQGTNDGPLGAVGRERHGGQDLRTDVLDHERPQRPPPDPDPALLVSTALGPVEIGDGDVDSLDLAGEASEREIEPAMDLVAELGAEVEVASANRELHGGFAADGMGALFVPTVIATTVARRYDLVAIREVEELRERYYAISMERRITHPAVVEIRAAARSRLFS